MVAGCGAADEEDDVATDARGAEWPWVGDVVACDPGALAAGRGAAGDGRGAIVAGRGAAAVGCNAGALEGGATERELEAAASTRRTPCTKRTVPAARGSGARFRFGAETTRARSGARLLMSPPAKVRGMARLALPRPPLGDAVAT